MPHKNTRSKSTPRSGRLAPDGRDPSGDYRSPALRGGSADSWADEAQRSGSNLQSHLALGLPGSQQDADNDNDDTTLFRRPGEWVSQLSTLVGHKTPEKLEDLDAPFRRGAPEPASRPQPPAARPRPPRPQPRPQPVAAEPRTPARDSLEPVQGELQRSLRPTRSRRRTALALSLPLFGALGALLVWNTPRAQWPLWKLPNAAITPTAATRSLTFPPRAPEPPVAPVAPPPAAAAPVLEPIVEDVPEEVTAPAPEAKPQKLSPREARRARAAERRARRGGRQSERISFTRQITPLPLTSTKDDDTTVEPEVGAGILQINSRPWARVFVDGRFVGNTPQRSLRLTAGWHRVRLINEPMGMSKSLDIEISAGQTARFIEMLEEDTVAKPWDQSLPPSSKR
ncbi:MAG TPA: PEGA domain-containing protein [Polyangiales bacterium]|nr:PEGA domain-containing protein [Polyangiales bacterium]